jgi:predicted TPR repeat methyltransferase
VLEGDAIRTYFDREAASFDQLYTRSPWDRLLRPAVYRRIELAQSLCGGRDVLDIGCGTGRIAIAMCDAGAKSVTGIDFSPAMIALGRTIAAASHHRDRITLDTGDFTRFETTRTWPLVVALGVFEYFEDLAACVRSVTPFVDDTLAFTVRRFTPLRGTVRAVRYRLAGCPIHFATERAIRNACRAYASVTIDDGGPGSYWVVARR